MYLEAWGKTLAQSTMQDRDQHMLDHGEVYFLPDLLGNRCDLALLEATGVDELVVGYVGIDIEGKAVHGDEATTLDTDSTDLALTGGVADVKPYPCRPLFEASIDTEEA